MHGLQVAGVSRECHLAQELVTYQVVVPDLEKREQVRADRRGTQPTFPRLGGEGVCWYLNYDGLSWLLAVEEAFHIKLWRHRVLLHRGANLLPFALYDHVRVSSWREKREFILFSCLFSKTFSRDCMQQFSSTPHQRRWISFGYLQR